MKHSISHLSIPVFILAILLCWSSSANSSALDDRILVLPLVCNPDFELDAEDLWRTVLHGYMEGTSNIEVIPMEKVIEAMEGDTLRYDLLAFGEAMEWGQRLDADFVIMGEALGTEVSLQRMDPWTGESFGPYSAEDPLVAVRKLEIERWVYGRKLLSPPTDYHPPQIVDASDTITAWIHENGEYPPDAIISLKGCVANVAVTVSPEGVPIDIRIHHVDPEGYEFERAIAKALWSMRFEPAMIGDKVVHGMWISTVYISPTM
ncbi:MAG TPA: hypothetical protein ENH10_08550 [Bacteroidetes bacterium]|nr:hypothetical protein [Bacteroidota bacterium]HEX05185.1 hypothetical protein [Bacteroidota bacterium]